MNLSKKKIKGIARKIRDELKKDAKKVPDAVAALRKERRKPVNKDRLYRKKPLRGTAHSIEEAVALAQKIGFPCLVFPAFSVGGGVGVANDANEIEAVAKRALMHSLSCEVLVGRAAP
jgi:carbamoyl-phosphate synthase large subunit